MIGTTRPFGTDLGNGASLPRLSSRSAKVSADAGGGGNGGIRGRKPSARPSPPPSRCNRGEGETQEAKASLAAVASGGPFPSGGRGGKTGRRRKEAGRTVSAPTSAPGDDRGLGLSSSSSSSAASGKKKMMTFTAEDAKWAMERWEANGGASSFRTINLPPPLASYAVAVPLLSASPSTPPQCHPATPSASPAGGCLSVASTAPPSIQDREQRRAPEQRRQ